MITIEKDIFDSIVVEDDNGKFVTISEGDNIQFTTESGELHTGKVDSFKGKKDKLEIVIVPSGKECKEVWKIAVMSEGSLTLNKE